MLGENILKLRKNMKLSQEELGAKVGVTRQTISNWELGETSPNPEQLKLLSKILNISIDELLDNNDYNAILHKISSSEKMTRYIYILLTIVLILVIIICIYCIGTGVGKFIAILGS